MVLIYSNKRKNGGFLVLTMVLLVCAVVLIVATGVLFRSIGEVNQSAETERSLEAWSTVNACAEYALAKISKEEVGSSGWNYTGGEPLEIEGNICYIYPIVNNDNDGSKTIKASSTVSGFTKKISVEVATNTPKVKITSWTEVADF
jgi:hypothetical protein